ncbi:hypothetical protein [Desulfatiglans anilini]|uniref:hypothetical protein n=1 Tax=Desulfatiglans anilini TaxID=90728 RepID=UPI0004842B54|nr:hypothetical protein [Desulfatiglans anilini]
MFSARGSKDSHGVLTGSADLLEAMLTALREKGLTLQRFRSSQSKGGSTEGERIFTIKYEKDALLLIIKAE